MKQTSIKKMLALFLIAAVMLAAFTACKSEKTPGTSSTQPAEQGQVEATTAETQKAEPITINFFNFPFFFRSAI